MGMVVSFTILDRGIKCIQPLTLPGEAQRSKRIADVYDSTDYRTSQPATAATAATREQQGMCCFFS